MPERHLLGVWNPAYAVDAMDAHLRVLLDSIAAYRAGFETSCSGWAAMVISSSSPGLALERSSTLRLSAPPPLRPSASPPAVTPSR